MSDVHVSQDNHDPECWRIEYMNYDRRGLFAGQDAERGAREYAQWLRTLAAKPSAIGAQPQGRTS